MANSSETAKTFVTTVRLSKAENDDLEELSHFFDGTKSDVLAEGMRMVRDLRLVIEDLLREDPELASVLKYSLIPGILNAELRRERVGEMAEKLLMGLVKKDLVGASRRALYVLKMFRE